MNMNTDTTKQDTPTCCSSSTIKTIVKSVSSQLLDVIEEATTIPNLKDHHETETEILDELSKVGEYLSSS